MLAHQFTIAALETCGINIGLTPWWYYNHGGVMTHNNIGVALM